jgi:glycosyltransferase involved in cell wall biosynthesis
MKNKIIVGVDISDLKVAATGQKTFLSELHTQFLWLDTKSNAIATDNSVSGQNFTFVYFSSPFPVIKSRSKIALLLQHLMFQLWKQLLLPILAWLKGCDIVFCTDYFVPYFHLGFKTVQVFHDAFFFQNSEHYNKHWFVLHKYLAMPAAKKSSFIITPSDYALKTVHQYAGISTNQLVRIYEAPKNLDSIEVDNNDPVLAGFIHTKYIFHVGVLEKRKNLLNLVKAYHILINNGSDYGQINLVLAGKGTGRAESDVSSELIALINELQLNNRIILTGYLTDKQLKTTYQNALMYVFPSLNEGFGIPVLEAFKARIPVLVANNSCLPEIGGDAVLQFDPFNIKDIAEKMQRVIDNADIRNDLIAKGDIRLKDFSWEKAAQEVLKVFVRAIQ